MQVSKQVDTIPVSQTQEESFPTSITQWDNYHYTTKSDAKSHVPDVHDIAGVLYITTTCSIGSYCPSFMEVQNEGEKNDLPLEWQVILLVRNVEKVSWYVCRMNKH